MGQIAVVERDSVTLGKERKRTQQESIELKHDIIVWALTLACMREHKTADEFAKAHNCAASYVRRVAATAPRSLEKITEVIDQVMISKALQGDVTSANYVHRLREEQVASKAGSKKESKEDRIVRAAVARFPRNTQASALPDASLIPTDTSLAETRQTYERAGVTPPATST